MRGKNIKIIAVVLVIVAAIAYLIFSSLGAATASYFIPVEQALSRNVEMDKFYRIEGKIDVENAKFDGTKNPVELKFAIYDEKNTSKKLTIIYNDIKPDNFAEATSAVVEGKFNSDGTFKADKLMLKCPTKYEQVETPKDEGIIAKLLKFLGLKS